MSSRGGGSSGASNGSNTEVAESILMSMASSRSSLCHLFYPSLESEVVGSYMASRRRHYNDQQWITLVYGMHTSCTLYVGNLSFFTREEQVHELFSRVAPVRRVIMGLNSNTRTPCGFCFVEYFNHVDALSATNLLNGLKLDDRIMKADLDAAFEEGRQYGRGKGGGQINDDHRSDFDAARGGWGTYLQAKKEREETFEKIKQAQMDEFGATPDNGEMYDPETYGGGYERQPSSSSIFNVDRPLKLNQATLTACMEGIFPHYGLPLDDRVKKALADHIATTNPTTVATSSPPTTSVSAVTPSLTSPTTATVTPPGSIVPQQKRATSPSASYSPATKRPRHTSPTSMAASSRSPQPISTSQSFDQPFTAAAAYPSAAQPSSPQPILPAASTTDVDHAIWNDDRHDSDMSDGDRTPQHLGSDDDHRSTHRSTYDHQQLDDDQPTPPPSPPPQREDQDQDLHMADAADEDGDRTPQHLSPVYDQQQSTNHRDHDMATTAWQQEQEQEQVDDDATPPPDTNPDANDEDAHGFYQPQTTHVVAQQPNQPDYEEFAQR